MQNFISAFNNKEIENLINLLKPSEDAVNSTGPECINVLVVEDNELDFEIMQQNLRQMENYDTEIFYASDLDAARGISECVNIDIALVDYCLGVETGVHALNEIGGRCGDFASIMVSGMPSKDISQIALNAGAINYLDKFHINPTLLETTIRSAMYTHKIERRLSNTILELERADRAKSNFFARMSHDLKTPLNAIIGYSEAIQEGALGTPDAETYKRGITSIHKAGRHLLTVINDLILQSHRESEDQSSPFEITNLGELVSNSIDMVETFASSSNHDFQLTIKNTQAVSDCQPAMMNQAVINLLTNCVKYSPSGAHTHVVVSEEPDYCQISIKDNGIGMSDAELEVALSAYGRVSLVGENAREGTGIGLSIVQQIIERHSGMMEIKSATGEGTEVLLKLPKVNTEKQAA